MGRMTQYSFTDEERGELAQKVRSEMRAEGVDGLIVVGSGNITYLSGGIVFPYLDQRLVHPVALYLSFETGRSLFVTTFDLSDIPDQLGWQGETAAYELSETTPAKSLAAELARQLSAEDVNGKTIGMDYAHMTGGVADALAAALPSHDAIAIDDKLAALRIVKTEAEIRLLEITGRIGDRGFISALNHAEGAALDNLSYPMWEYGERYRVHVGEFGGSGVGNLSVLQGERARDLYSKTGTREVFVEHEFLRMEYSQHNYGYWVTGARTVYVGEPDGPAVKAWSDNVQLKNVAIDALRVGNKASDVYSAVSVASAESGIKFWQTTDIGHGVGTTEREAPFLAPFDQTELAAGMVVVVAVYTYGPKQELIGDKDLYLITDGAPQLLTWYRKWDQLYALHGTSARHG